MEASQGEIVFEVMSFLAGLVGTLLIFQSVTTGPTDSKFLFILGIIVFGIAFAFRVLALLMRR